MNSYPYYHIDAFTKRPCEGNQCAVILQADSINYETMQRIAFETNLAETAFCKSSSCADIKASYFTPAEEIPFAGSPTLSVIRALIESGVITRNHATFTIELKVGIVRVELKWDDPKFPLITMKQPAPTFGETYDKQLIANVCGLTTEQIRASVPVQTVSTGTPILMVPVNTLRDVIQAKLDLEKYVALRDQSDFDYLHIFCSQGFTQQGDTFARNFSAPPDLLEDPFTGSATGCMACYLNHFDLLRSDLFTAEQGHAMCRPSSAQVRVHHRNGKIAGVDVGGYAVTVIRGELRI